MATIREHVWLARSADDVWAFVGDPSTISEWSPGIASSAMKGTIRTCLLRRGGEVTEEILVRDNGLRRLQYAVRSGLPVVKHLGTVDVLAVGESEALVIYSTDVAPDGVAKGIGAAIRGSMVALTQRFGVPERASESVGP